MEELEEYLKLLEAGDAPDFEAWVAGRHADPSDLRRAWEDWQAGFQALGGRPVERYLIAGSTVGPYTLVRRLGRGGQGSVWEAREEVLDRTVALKLLGGGAEGERGHARFLREAKAVSRLQHEHVVTVHASGEDDGVPWIALELVPGGRTLRQAIDEAADRPVLPDGWYRQVARWLLSIANALEAAHAQDIIHRDVKPGNILLDPQGRAKVTDFGLALIEDLSAFSRSGELIGTYLYMSPEQIAAHRHGVDARTDVFSLGVVMYELLTLRTPFEGDTAHQICSKIITWDPPDPRRLRSHVPEELAVLCTKALEKDRDDRFASMHELAEELERYLTNRPIRTLPPGPLVRGRKWVARNPFKALALGTVGVGLVVVSGLSVLLSASNRDLGQANERLMTRAMLWERDRLWEAAKALWPPYPEKIPEMEAWLGQVEELEALLEGPTEAHPDTDGFLALLERLPPGEPESEELESLVEKIRELGGEDVAGTGTHATLGWGIERRLGVARELREENEGQDGYASRWASALSDIQDAYPDSVVDPHPDLVPLAPNPHSGLWEFWNPVTGSEPVMDEEGNYVLTPDSGLVFVLLPGGSVPDPHTGEIQLDAFFISKYEMNQAQWLRLTGSNPSVQDHDMFEDWWVRPVETVSWSDAHRRLEALALELPSEAQWNYAAASDERSTWWFGDTEGKEFEECGNVADQALKRARTAQHEDTDGWQDEFDYGWWDDRNAVTAAVHAFRPNYFGLHGMVGNVYEWCADSAGDIDREPDPKKNADIAEATGLRLYPAEVQVRRRIARGGSWRDLALFASSFSSNLRTYYPERRSNDLGVRPVRRIRP